MIKHMKEIEALSNEVQNRYETQTSQVGTEILGGHFHLGYWDNTTNDNKSATRKLTELMIDKVRIQPGQRFCDFGCGVGGPAIQLAETKGCYVDGITISEFQYNDACRRGLASSVPDSVRFYHGNALSTPWENETYDGGWFFESIFHMGHANALAETHRVLKPNAELIIADLPLLPHADDLFVKWSLEKGLAVHVHPDQYEALFSDAGFELVSYHDVSDNVMSPLVEKTKELIATETELLSMHSSPAAIDDALYVYDQMAGNLGYALITAKKKY